MAGQQTVLLAEVQEANFFAELDQFRKLIGPALAESEFENLAARVSKFLKLRIELKLIGS